MKNIIIFASGSGTNAEAIFHYSQSGAYKIAAIICDNPNAGILERGKNWDISFKIIAKSKGESVSDHESRILSVIKHLNFDLLVLAGYRRLLSFHFLSQFPYDSIINIHPSLLPLYPGLNSYEQAYRAEAKESGVTIHYVDAGMDTGKVIVQQSFKRELHDTLEEFSNRGLNIEHSLYPKTIHEILSKEHSYRLEIYPRRMELVEKKEELVGKIFWIKSEGPMAALGFFAQDILVDPIIEKYFLSHETELTDHLSYLGFNNLQALEISFLPGVTDNTAYSVRDAFKKHPFLKGKDLSVFSGKLVFGNKPTYAANMYLERSKNYSPENLDASRFQNVSLPEVKLTFGKNKTYNLNISDDELLALSQDNLWALSLDEMVFIKNYFSERNRNPTDVEIEIIAQTWSEHCKHKIFASHITHEDHEGKREVKSLFKTFIQGATKRIVEERGIDWTRSVFTDNAGIVRWDENLDVCIKVETHNSPSALDPYGGALTGILGVNRDILGCGLGAKPIANTDVFCLPPENADADGQWPRGLHSPKKIREGVHKGVQDGGNKSGIPTVNGAFHYDLSFSGKPLVYCGTIGVLPHEIHGRQSHEKNQLPGDYIVMIGGRIGMDGIHGATFSSLELKEGTPGSVVQIGDPLTQKRVTDFLLKARDLDLYSSITDNGAGGLSSSVGEMSALTNGARINLALAPVKYPGLNPAEIMISESQERMTCSVRPEKWNEFEKLAKIFNVEVSNLGQFTNDGFLTVMYGSEEVGKLSLSFLHEDLPPMKLTSSWSTPGIRKPWKALTKKANLGSTKEKVLALLRHENIKSHENWVRQYDHEVKAASVTKPFSPDHGPSDAGVIAMKPHGGGERNGVIISSGLCPQISLQDTKLMAMYAVDEAVRNAVVTGADPERMVLVDNFCWPDSLPGPNNPDYAQKLGELVRANEGLYDISVALGLPLVSGKDSMKNDAIVQYQNQKTKISVLPTLLMTVMSHIDDVSKVIRASFKSQDDLWLLGGDENLSEHTLSDLNSESDLNWPLVSLDNLKNRYQVFHKAHQLGLIHGAHDVSEGGFLISLIEMSINSQCGFEMIHGFEEKFFGEGMGIIVFSSLKENREKVSLFLKEAKLIATARADKKIHIGQEVLDLSECVAAFKGESL